MQGVVGVRVSAPMHHSNAAALLPLQQPARGQQPGVDFTAGIQVDTSISKGSIAACDNQAAPGQISDFPIFSQPAL